MFLLRNIEWYWSEGYKTCEIMGICIDTKKTTGDKLSFRILHIWLMEMVNILIFVSPKNAFYLYDKRTNGSK